MPAFKSDFLRILSERGFIHQISDETGLDDLFAKETVSAYIGFDPTASSLHAGGLIQIMMRLPGPRDPPTTHYGGNDAPASPPAPARAKMHAATGDLR